MERQKDAVILKQQLAEGGDLQSHVRQFGPFGKEKLIKQIFGQILSGIHYLHYDLGITHNDVKLVRHTVRIKHNKKGERFSTESIY